MQAIAVNIVSGTETAREQIGDSKDAIIQLAAAFPPEVMSRYVVLLADNDDVCRGMVAEEAASTQLIATAIERNNYTVDQAIEVVRRTYLSRPKPSLN